MTHFNNGIARAASVERTECRPWGSRSNRNGMAKAVSFVATNDPKAVDCPKCRALLAKAVAK